MNGKWLALALILIGFALRLWGLSSQPIWWDEARNIIVASRPLKAIPSSGELDIHPPLYFFLLHFWMRLGGWASPETAITLDEKGFPHDQAFAFFLRFLSLAFGILSLPLLFRVGAKLGGQNLAALAMAAFSLAPFWVTEAQQIRMYTTMVALLLAAAAMLWEGTREQKAWQFVGFGVAAALSLLTHYSAFWILAGWAFFLAFWSVKKGLKGLALTFTALITALAIFLPQLPRALQQTLGYANLNLTIPSLPSFLKELIAAWGVYPQIIVPLSLLGALAIIASKRWEQALFLLSWLIIPASLYYISFFQKGGAFEPRYIAGISPALYLLVGAAAWGRREPGWAIGLALTGLFVSGLWKEARTPSFIREDSRALASYLYSHTSPADVIITDAPFPLNLYWPGFYPNRGNFARAFYLFADPYSLPATLSEVTEGKRQAILVHWFKSDADPRGIIKLLLDKHGELLEEASFTGYHLWRYRLPEGKIQFSFAPSPEEIGARFGGLLILEKADWGGREPAPVSLSPDWPSVAPGHNVWIALYWHLAQPTAETLKVAGYLRDERGFILSQDDRWLLNDRHLRTPFWGEVNRSWVFLSIPVPLGTIPGRYWVSIAVYEENSGERLPVLDSAGNPAGTELKLGLIEVVKPAKATPSSALQVQSPCRIELGDIAFLGHGGVPPELAPGQSFFLKSYWEALKPGIPAPIEFSLLDESGKIATTWKVSLSGKAEVEGEAWWEWVELPIPPEIPPGKYKLALNGEAVPGEISIKGRPRFFSPPPIANRLEILFGRGIALRGYEIAREGDKLKLTLLWECRERIPDSYTVFTHLLDEGGRYLTGHDSPPDGGNAPTTSWLPGEFVVDVHEIPLPSELRPGQYFLEIGLYKSSPEGLLRLPTSQGKDSVLLPFSP